MQGRELHDFLHGTSLAERRHVQREMEAAISHPSSENNNDLGIFLRLGVVVATAFVAMSCALWLTQ
ncbi:conserved hypothetical protein [Chelatococcus asaccharovorans]|uniref:Uncharacterized protein n=1 Tax=Chelatococcus asaccharovorans TaxID=28210 RepID=A0A2V3TYJ1_9HYPH|nr:hypothetical protein C7450_112160 [Chelatococcus asaccharovorans]CAH1649302.1 conserved hypothetical protein [Chelatococcus asaccharovorans]CAH1691472.1 conserved hypothetical protein [Chelatococcus asaccharovorans]